MSSRTTYEGRGENRYTTGPKEDLGRAIRLNRAEQSRTEPICFVAIRCDTREAEGSRRQPNLLDSIRWLLKKKEGKETRYRNKREFNDFETTRDNFPFSERWEISKIAKIFMNIAMRKEICSM